MSSRLGMYSFHPWTDSNNVVACEVCSHDRHPLALAKILVFLESLAEKFQEQMHGSYS